jgi:hypothetical protein
LNDQVGVLEGTVIRQVILGISGKSRGLQVLVACPEENDFGSGEKGKAWMDHDGFSINF